MINSLFDLAGIIVAIILFSLELSVLIFEIVVLVGQWGRHHLKRGDKAKWE